MIRVRSRRGRRVAAMVAVAFAGGLAGAPRAGGAGAVSLTATIDGQRFDTASQARPLKLTPQKDALVVVDVTNNSASPLNVRTIRLEGQVIGLTFFAYDTTVALTVAPGAGGSRRFVLDLSGLSGQATGLIPGAVKLLDSNRHVVAETDGVVDVRGSLRSVYGLFGLGVAFLTALSFLGAIVGLAGHRLPANRWRRALRFLTPGLGLGLVINFTLSATRVFVFGIGRWLAITAVCAALLFTLGYLTPTPDLEEPEPVAEEPVQDQVALLAILSRPARPAVAAAPAYSVLEAGPDPALALEEAPTEHHHVLEAGPPERAGPVSPLPAPATISSDPRATLPAGTTVVWPVAGPDEQSTLPPPS